MNTRNRFYQSLLAALLLVSLGACKKTIIDPPPPPVSNLPEFFNGLPTWEEFADNPPVTAAAPTGGAPTALSQTLDVPQIQEDGSIDTLYNVTYDCQQTPYSLSEDPQQIVMYSPDLEILWPGGLIQGKTHKNALGSLTGLVIAERDSINVSIPGLPTGDNFRRVKPNQAIVGSAIGEMIGNATADNLSTPSTITFSMESYHSEKQMALSMGLSGKYLGFSGSASGSFERDQSETTVTVQFFQKMYEVVVAPPQTPSAFFSDEFTPEKLQEQTDLGKMGPDNLPVYVSNVVYGRMMMFSLTSTASETEIRAMLNLAYNGIGGNVKADMSAKQKTILEESKMAVTSLGGDAEATLSMIRSGNWKDYFTSTAPLSSAAPLSYTFRNLGDGSIAKIVETDEFNISECTEKVGVPGVFDYYPGETASMGDISFPVETYMGDFNNDGLEDIMLNHKDNNTNQVKIGFGNAEGSFDFQSSVSNTASPSDSWTKYKTRIADLNGDDADDIIWNNTEVGNSTHFALNDGSGLFSFSDETKHPNNGWGRYDLLIGDINADGNDELVWNITDGNTTNRTYTASLSADNQSLEFTPYHDNGVGWSQYDAYIGEVNGGGADLLFSRTDDINRTYIGKSQGDGTFVIGGYFTRAENGWGNYTTYTGHADNNTTTDLLFNYPGTSTNRLYVSPSLPNATMNSSIPAQDHPVSQDWTSYKMLIGDVDGDGIDDISWTNHGNGDITSNVFTALGTNTGEYDFTPVKQSSPYQSTWSQFESFMLDINGDSKKDMLWIKPGSTTEYYVALAK
ncbi:MAG: thiol-activated cytolysin family protein [Bacteroidia bacterium]